MLFKTYSLSPYCFKINYLSDFSKQFKITNVLNNIINNGLLFQLASENWKQKVFNFINEQNNDDLKKIIQELLIEIDKKNKIMSCENRIISNENEWIENIKEYCNNINYLIATAEQYCVKKLENIEVDNKVTTIQRQNEENLKELLKPIIPFVSLVKLYDPYFNITEDRYKKIINLILELSNFCERDNINIEIHTTPIFIKKNEKDLNNNQKILQTFQNNNIKIYVWKYNKNDKFHDRYISTNICALGLGKGADVDKHADSTWTLLSCEEIEKIEKKFDQNNPNGYNLLVKIDKNEIEKLENIERI